MPKECACLTCITACVRCPGRLVPDDLAPIASHLGLSVPELMAKYLTPSDDLDNTGALRPQWIKNYGCVFLKNQRCSIHAVKPFECREWTHDVTSEQVDAIIERIGDAWREFPSTDALA